MEERQGIFIIGGSGCGKTHRAKQEAEKTGGPYWHTSWDELQDGFSLRDMLTAQPKPTAIIVEGFEPTKRGVAVMKGLLGGDFLARPEFSGLDVKPLPQFIFTVQSEAAPFPPQTFKGRIHVIHLPIYEDLLEIAKKSGWQAPVNDAFSRPSWIRYWYQCAEYKKNPAAGRPVVPHR